MATGTRCRPGRRLRPLYALELRGRTARSPSTREVRMPPQLHARPKRSTRPSEGMVCSRAFPSVRASARHDGQRLHECGIQDREALVKAGALLVEIGDQLNLEVSPISCRRMPRRSRRVPRCGRWVGRNSPPGDPRGPGGISQGIGAASCAARGCKCALRKPSTYGLFCPFCAPPRSVPNHSLSLGLAHDRWVSVRVIDVSIRCN